MANVTRSEPLYDQIYEIVWQSILDGDVPMGQRLRDVEWAARLKVSRTPVREAFRKLQQDGILEPLGNGRHVLKKIGPDELRSLYRCRAVLEALALRDIEKPLSRKDIDFLKGLTERTDKALKERNFKQVFDFNTRFHDVLVSASANAHVVDLIAHIGRLILYSRSALKLLISQKPSLTTDYAEHLVRSQMHHRQILERLEARDLDGAADCMQAHLFDTGDGMCALVKSAAAP